MSKSINICIIHYNTPKLTQCLIKSINKFTPNSNIYVFDNSDKFPFDNIFDNVTVFDNTNGKYINFDEWLETYPNKNGSKRGKRNNWASAKHCYSVEKCMELIDDNFILLDSDVLLKQDISSLYDKNYIYIGEIVEQPYVKNIYRILPFICFINVKKCKKHNIHYFNKEYMLGLNDSVEGDKYDTGGGFYKATEDFSHKEIQVCDYIVHYKCGSWNDSLNATKHDMTQDEWLFNYKDLWYNKNELHHNKKVIYTCITNSYDSLIEYEHKIPGFDYICFTDDINLSSNIWEIRLIPSDLQNLSTVKQQRYIKIHPHLFLSDYEYSVWVDGRVEVLADPTELFTNAPITIPLHPQRNCIYDEGAACIKLKKDTPENINTQLNRYRSEGFPENYGLVQSNIIIRKHNSKKCIKLMNTWWDELYKGSHRDQLSFNYAVWKNPEVPIKYLDKKIFRSKWFYWYSTHGNHFDKNKKVNTFITPKCEYPEKTASYCDIYTFSKPIKKTEVIEKKLTTHDTDIKINEIKLDKPIKRIFY